MAARDLRHALLAFAVLVCSESWASPAADAEAKRHFDEATKAFNLREFEHAIDEYKAAYRANPYPVFLYNIAQSYRFLNEPSQAIEFYRSYLRLRPDAPNKAEVEKHIRNLEEQMAHAPAAASPPSAPAQAAPKPPVEVSAPPQPPPATPATALSPTTVEKPRPARPAYKKWWLWTAVGVGAGVVAGAVVLGVVLGGSHAPTPTMGQVAGN